MKVPFHLGSHARFVVMRCSVVIQMVHRRAPRQSCGVFCLLWKLVSRPCSVYVHGGRSGMQWGVGVEDFTDLQLH